MNDVQSKDKIIKEEEIIDPPNPKSLNTFSPTRLDKLQTILLSNGFRMAITVVLFILIFIGSFAIAALTKPDSSPSLPKTPSPTPLQTSTVTPSPSKNTACFTSGCNGEICQSPDEEPLTSICLYKPEYACLKYSTCEIQENGKCGWTQNDEYATCLNNPPNLETNTFCGGIAGIACSEGYICKLDGNYPDAGGTCVVN